jgi:anthranilate phosphoribosyltransferase
MDKLSTATTSQVWTVREDRISCEVVDPDMLGIPRPVTGALRGGDADTNARVVHDLLAGRPGPVRDVVLLNAAAALVAAAPADAPVVDQIRAAIEWCARAIDTGAAADTLTRWIRVAQARQHRCPV